MRKARLQAGVTRVAPLLATAPEASQGVGIEQQGGYMIIRDAAQLGRIRRMLHFTREILAAYGTGWLTYGGALLALSSTHCASGWYKGANQQLPKGPCASKPDGAVIETYDLGEGTIEDIRTKAPGFYELPPEGAAQPDSFGANGERVWAHALRFNLANRRRIAELRQSHSSSDARFALHMVQDGGVNYAELAPVSPVTVTVILFTSKTGEPAILIGRRGCQTYVGSEVCRDGESRTEARVATSGACAQKKALVTVSNGVFGPPIEVDSFARTTWAALGVETGRAEEVDVGVAGLGHDLRIRLRLDNFQGGSLDDVATLLERGETHAAFQVLSIIPGPISADEFERIGALRRDAYERAFAAHEVPDELYGYRPYEEGALPGDEVVKPLVVAWLLDRAERPPSEDRSRTLITSLQTFSALALWDPDNEQKYRERLTALHDNYGVDVGAGKLTPHAVRMFAEAFPKSGYLRILHEGERIAAAEEARKGQVARWWPSMNGLMETIAETWDEARFARKVAPMSRYPMATVLEGARRLDAHAQYLLDEEFCACKRELMKYSTKEEYASLARAACASPPVARNRDARVLDDECRRVFAYRCSPLRRGGSQELTSE